MRKMLVVLPAGRIFEQLFAHGIRPVCHDLQLEIANPPLHLNNAGVLEQLQRMVRDADLLLADLSAANAAVLYVVGFAEALGKTLILTTIAAEDFPLNLQHREPIVHAAHAELLAKELKAKLRSLLAPSDPRPAATVAPADPHATARQDFETIFGDILKQHQHRHTGPVYKENDTTFVLENNDMELALVQDLARHARSLNMRLKLL